MKGSSQGIDICRFTNNEIKKFKLIKIVYRYNKLVKT